MIKILLSLSRHGLALRRDSLPPVQARRIVAAHLSKLSPHHWRQTGGPRSLLKPRYLTFVLGRGNKSADSGRKPLALRAAMRGTDEGDEHLNMKGAVCDLPEPRAVHLQGIDPITQKQAIQTANKTSSQASLLPR